MGINILNQLKKKKNLNLMLVPAEENNLIMSLSRA